MTFAAGRFERVRKAASSYAAFAGSLTVALRAAVDLDRDGYAAVLGGDDWAFAWGPQDDDESIAAIRRALDLGINWIDTAAVYGLGHSEEVVARALDGITPRPLVFTKCSLAWNDAREIHHSLKAASIKREIEGSLRRLRVDAIDLYQIHWPQFGTGGNAPDIEEGWQALADLQQAGKARYIGVSNFDAAQLARVAPIAPITSLQPPYSMLMRGIEAQVLPYCQAHDIGVIAYSPMQSGLLSGAMTRQRIASFPPDDWRRRSAEFQEPKLTRNLELVEKLRDIGARHGRSPGEIAIAWTLRHPAVTGAIVGARRPSQVDGFIGAATFRLSDDEINEVEALLR
jgi:aryl-alcohol dehydrogenase-like predicted oxidoreductase